MHLALYVMLCLIWGSTWLVIKVGYGGLGPFNVAAVRFLIAGAVLMAIVPLLRARWPSTRTEWPLVAWVGLVLFAADYGLIYWGEQFLDSGMTSILFALLPLVTIGFAHLYVPGDRITSRKLAGTVLAFVGIVALFGGRIRIDPAGLGPMLAIVASTVCAAAAGVATKRHGATLHPAALNAPAMLIGAAALAVASLIVAMAVTSARHFDVGGDRLSGHRGQRHHVSRLLHTAQDVVGDEPEFHQRVHTRDCADSWIRVPG